MARKFALENSAVFIDQFENLANFNAHYFTTGPEIWNQLNGNINCFVMSAGTGGTIAGVSTYLKEKDPRVKIVLADPQGSSLFYRVKYGVCFTNEQIERKIRKHRYDSIAEGIGLDRVTTNFSKAKIDTGFKISDQEALDMAHWLLENEGLFVGSSSAINIVAACKAAMLLSPDASICTIICDNGRSHLSRFWNKEYISSDLFNLKWPDPGIIPECLKIY